MKRRFLVFIIILFATISVTVFITLKTTPLYKATALLRIEPALPDGYVCRYPNSAHSSALWQQYYQTEAQLLKSVSFCSRVIERLPDHLKREFDENDDPARVLATGLQVELQKDTFLLQVSYTGVDPHKITTIVNTVADAFEVYLIDKYRRHHAQRAMIIEKKTLPELQMEAEKALQEYIDFQRKHGFQDLEQEQKQRKQLIDRLNEKITTMNLKILELESQHKILMTLSTTYDERLLDIPMIKDEQIIINLRSERHQLEKELEKKTADPGKEPTDYKQLETELNKVKKDLQDIVLNKISAARWDLELEIDMLKEGIESLKKRLDEEVNKLANINALIVESDALKAKYEGKKEICDFLLKQLGSVDLGQREMLATARVIDYARVPQAPFKPDKIFNITVGTILGLCLGLLAALIIR